MFTQGLSRELGGRGITVNNVQSGPTDTGFESCGQRLGDSPDGYDCAWQIRDR
jgi:NAD(P)-dependent dehydrogenase (short-subunit alcohol dehydrogenase family)